MGLADQGLNQVSVVLTELLKSDIFLVEVGDVEGSYESVELLLLVSHSVFLDNDGPSQVLQQVLSEGIEGLGGLLGHV